MECKGLRKKTPKADGVGVVLSFWENQSVFSFPVEWDVGFSGGILSKRTSGGGALSLDFEGVII